MDREKIVKFYIDHFNLTMTISQLIMCYVCYNVVMIISLHTWTTCPNLFVSILFITFNQYYYVYFYKQKFKKIIICTN